MILGLSSFERFIMKHLQMMKFYEVRDWPQMLQRGNACDADETKLVARYTPGTSPRGAKRHEFWPALPCRNCPARVQGKRLPAHPRKTSKTPTGAGQKPANGPEGRTYADCESVNERVEGVWKMYEEPRKGMNPNGPSVADDVGWSLV